MLHGSTEQQKEFWSNLLKNALVLSLTESEINVAIDIMRELKKRNKMIELPDILIAATAVANNLSIATLNLKHFGRIPELKLIKLS